MSLSARISVITIVLALAGCASSPEPAQEPEPEVDEAQTLSSLPWPTETLRYTCEEGTELQVAYSEPAEGDGLAALLYDDTLHLLRPRPAAAGSRYVSVAEQGGLRWHIQGREGVLQRLAPDHTAEVETLLTDCVGRPGP